MLLIIIVIAILAVAYFFILKKPSTNYPANVDNTPQTYVSPSPSETSSTDQEEAALDDDLKSIDLGSDSLNQDLDAI